MSAAAPAPLVPGGDIGPPSGVRYSPAQLRALAAWIMILRPSDGQVELPDGRQWPLCTFDEVLEQLADVAALLRWLADEQESCDLRRLRER